MTKARITTSEPDEVRKFILKYVKKMPRKVTLVGNGYGLREKVCIGSFKTTIRGVHVKGREVIVTFKDKVWGSTTHEAWIYDGKIYFSLEATQGRGIDPHFILSL